MVEKDVADTTPVTEPTEGADAQDPMPQHGHGSCYSFGTLHVAAIECVIVFLAIVRIDILDIIFGLGCLSFALSLSLARFLVLFCRHVCVNSSKADVVFTAPQLLHSTSEPDS